MLDGVIVPFILLVVNVGGSVNAEMVGYFPLQKSFLVSAPAELVRGLGDGFADIELCGFL